MVPCAQILLHRHEPVSLFATRPNEPTPYVYIFSYRRSTSR